ncbi:MAG: DUF3794 domain-containing protein [Clostridia bacterium]|nr:DUF3794 domain-containing protein [Clostridia bacterium]MDE7215896.1 DUF3794 domain-containing protein [Clostridia bacterium]
MAINTIFKSVSADYERNLDGKQIVMQCNFDTTSKGGVSKVCALSGDVRITKTQTMSKQIKTSGRVSIKLVYLDAEGKLNNFDYISDFSEDINNDGVVADMPCIVRAVVVDMQSSISGAEIKVQTVVELMPSVVEINTVDVLEDAEDALTLKEEQTYQKYVCSVDECVEVTDEYSCGAKVDDVLFFDAKAIVSDVDNSDGKLVVTGRAEVSLIYTSEGIVSTKNFNIPFAQELAVKDENLCACISAGVKENRLVIEGSESDNAFKITVNVALQGFVMQTCAIDAVTDLYSPSNSLDVSVQDVTFDRQDGVMSFEEKIGGSVTVENSDDIIKSICSCIVTQNNLSNLVAMDGALLAEGVLNTSVIYETEDGANKCMQVELPYSLQFDAENVTSQTLLCGSAIATDCSYKVKRDREVEISAGISISVCAMTRIVNTVVKSVEEGEEISTDSNAISIYLPDKGESIWQVAKTLGMSIESIKEQNPDIGALMAGDERIVIYREIG